MQSSATGVIAKCSHAQRKRGLVFARVSILVCFFLWPRKAAKRLSADWAMQFEKRLVLATWKSSLRETVNIRCWADARQTSYILICLRPLEYGLHVLFVFWNCVSLFSFVKRQSSFASYCKKIRELLFTKRFCTSRTNFLTWGFSIAIIISKFPCFL